MGAGWFALLVGVVALGASAGATAALLFRRFPRAVERGVLGLALAITIAAIGAGASASVVIYTLVVLTAALSIAWLIVEALRRLIGPGRTRR